MDQKSRWVFIAAAYVGNVGKLQRAATRHDRGVGNLLQVVVRPFEAQKHLRSFGLDRAGRRHRILTLQRRKNIARTDAECRQAGIGKLDKDPLGTLAEDVDLLDASDVE